MLLVGHRYVAHPCPSFCRGNTAPGGGSGSRSPPHALSSFKGFSELRAQWILNIAIGEGHKHHVFHPRISLDLTVAEQEQPRGSNRLYFM